MQKPKAFVSSDNNTIVIHPLEHIPIDQVRLTNKSWLEYEPEKR